MKKKKPKNLRCSICNNFVFLDIFVPADLTDPIGGTDIRICIQCHGYLFARLAAALPWAEGYKDAEKTRKPVLDCIKKEERRIKKSLKCST